MTQGRRTVTERISWAHVLVNDRSLPIRVPVVRVIKDQKRTGIHQGFLKLPAQAVVAQLIGAAGGGKRFPSKPTIRYLVVGKKCRIRPRFGKAGLDS